jgi:transcriptional regulator with XRE-family HTH domain
MQELKELRRMAGWTQAKASRATGVNRSKLSQVECGEIDLSPAEEVAVRRVLVAAVRERAARLQVVLANKA